MAIWVRRFGLALMAAAVLGCGVTAYFTNAAADTVKKSWHHQYDGSVASDGERLSQAVWADALLPLLGCLGGFAVGVAVFVFGVALDHSPERRPSRRRGAVDYDAKIRKRKERSVARAKGTLPLAPSPRPRTSPTLPPIPMADDPPAEVPASRPPSSTAGDPEQTRPLADSGEDSPAVAPSDGHRYRLGEELARGGMGVVHRATDLTLGREVAVKVVAPQLVGTAAARRFVAEAELTGRLQHPGIPPVHDLGTLPDGRPYLAMKLIRGNTLAAELHARSSPADDLERFVQIFEQICLAVAFAHSRRILHRDLKPANVMVGAFGEVQVMDWGLAKVLTAADEPAGAGELADDWNADPEGRTQAGQVMGTPAYMPPEQARGLVDQTDERADVFALGGILCVILTGRPPYTGSSGRAVLGRAATADLDDALTRLAAVTGAGRFPVLAKRCLRPRAGDRFSHAGELAAAVHAARQVAERRKRKDEVDAATTTADREARTARWRSQRVLAVAGGVAFAAVSGAGVWSCISADTATSSREREEAIRQRLESQRVENSEVYFPLAVLLAEREVAAGTFKPGWDGQGRERVIETVRKTAQVLAPREKAFAQAVIAGLHTAAREEGAADSAWAEGVKLFSPDDSHAEVRYASAVVRQFTGKKTPTELDAIILKRAAVALNQRTPGPLPPDLQNEVTAAKAAVEKGGIK